MRDENKKKQSNRLTDSFHIFYLFFLYEPLCMSLHDAVGDHLWSCGVKKTPRLQNYLRAILETLPLNAFTISAGDMANMIPL
jgi:hypothetical protein